MDPPSKPIAPPSEMIQEPEAHLAVTNPDVVVKQITAKPEQQIDQIPQVIVPKDVIDKIDNHEEKNAIKTNPEIKPLEEESSH